MYVCVRACVCVFFFALFLCVCNSNLSETLYYVSYFIYVNKHYIVPKVIPLSFRQTCLLSYAGLPCEDIGGHSKGVGYEPGMEISEDTFRNTWNLVLIGGNWWPVHCNWGAR